MGKADVEISILTNATIMAGALLKADKNKQQEMLLQLKALESSVKHTQLDAHKNLKRFVLLTVAATIRYIYHGKQSDAKLAQRNGDKVASEFARLGRLAQRQERDVMLSGTRFSS